MTGTDTPVLNTVPVFRTAAAAPREGVVAVGNFDGVHPGHRAVIREARTVADRLGAPLGVLTFEPHPRTVFQPGRPVFRLTHSAEKSRVLGACGVDHLVELTFDKSFSGQSPDAFVGSILVDGLGVRHVVTGYDFHFGRARAGTPAFLTHEGNRLGFGVTIVEALTNKDGLPRSSSAIRTDLEAGDVGGAAKALGYRWFVTGGVVHGEKRGRLLGFPTANIRLADDCRLAHGIYAVRAIIKDRRFDGVASYGRRPQFDNGRPLLETYLFEFSGHIYGIETAVEFVSFLRTEKRFKDTDALVTQMDRDCRQARAVTSAIADEPFGALMLLGKDKTYPREAGTL